MFGRSGIYLLAALMVLGVLLVGCPEEPRDLGADPEARFEATPASGHVPLLVEFFDTSDPGVSGIGQWHWDFGDSTTSTDRDPRHMYVRAGNYAVTLRVTTAIGSSTKVVQNCVTVTDPIAVAAIGAAGGSIEAFDGTLTAPAGAFGGQVIVGMTAGEGQMPVDFSEQEQVVSLVYTIQHNQPDLRVDPRNALELDLPFYSDMVPEPDRTGDKLYLFVRNGNGARIPVPGRVEEGRFIAEIAGLPRKADYAVVWRPAVLVETVVAAFPLKTPTSYNWTVGKWRIAYSPAMLQTLTALRWGNPLWLSPYDWRDFSSPEVEATLAQLREQVTEIHDTADTSGCISPMLNVSPGDEYNLLFYQMSPPISDYEWVGETLYASSLYGSIVIDPEQLVAISKRQAIMGGDDGRQEMEFVHAFSEEFFRTIFRGYDCAPYMTTVIPQYGLDRRPISVPFTLGFGEGLAVYMSQVAAAETACRPNGTDYTDCTPVFKPRAFSSNEYALLSEPLFAPASQRTAGYATATQDFFFYIANKYVPEDPLTFVTDSWYGVLEMLRTHTGAYDVSDYESAMRQARMGVDTSLRGESIQKGLPELYWEYACDRAFENPDDSKLRPSDYFLKACTFNWDKFEPEAVAWSMVNGLYEQTFTGGGYPRLQDVPPLTTVAVVLTAANTFACDLKVAVNAYDWDVDTYGNRMRAMVYLADGPGHEIKPDESETVLEDFGASAKSRTAVVLLCNTSMEDFYSAEVTITPRARQQ